MWGIIGGSGFEQFDAFQRIAPIATTTPFGEASTGFSKVAIGQHEAIFIPRHGEQHESLPTEINYRANIFALKQAGASAVLSLSAVGSLQEALLPGDCVIPHQYIDRTKGIRAHTFCGDGLVGHVPLAYPVCHILTEQLRHLSQTMDFSVHLDKTYVCIEGPYFSTIAESASYQKMGADIVGMTNFPEFALAREAGLHYLSCCFITNYSAWDKQIPHANPEKILEMMRHNNSKAFQITQKLIAYEPPINGQCECSGSGLNIGLMTPKANIPENKSKWLEVLLK